MSKTKQSGAKRALKGPVITAYAFVRPGFGKYIFHTRRGALAQRRVGSDSPIQKLTSVPSELQVALTRGIARKYQIDLLMGQLRRAVPSRVKGSASAYRETLMDLLHIMRGRVAFEEGLTEDGQLL
jgi:hypothetical protein